MKKNKVNWDNAVAIPKIKKEKLIVMKEKIKSNNSPILNWSFSIYPNPFN